MGIKDSIREKIAKLRPDEFETFCCRLLATEFEEYKTIESSLNWYGTSAKGTPDAYVRDPEGNFTLFQFTVEKNKVKQKILTDLAKIGANKEKFKPIKRVVICIASPLTQVVSEFHKQCGDRNWEGQDFSLDKLTHIAEKHLALCSDYLSIIFNPENPARKSFQSERYYDCGKRISEVRKDISLSPTQFIELIDYPSEKLYKQIESESEECGEETLRKISLQTGIPLDWLKHAIGSKYPVERDWVLSEHAIKNIAKEYPQKVLLTVQKENLSVKMLVHLTSYNWKKYSLGLSIDFWNWFDDHRYIPQFYRFLQSLKNTFYSDFGAAALTAEQDELLYSTQTHPHALAEEIFHRRRHNWARQLLDVDFRNYDKEDYAQFHGEWFTKVQEEFIRLKPYLEKRKDEDIRSLLTALRRKLSADLEFLLQTKLEQSRNEKLPQSISARHSHEDQ
jgi:hypothetical protein